MKMTTLVLVLLVFSSFSSMAQSPDPLNEVQWLHAVSRIRNPKNYSGVRNTQEIYISRNAALDKLSQAVASFVKQCCIHVANATS